MGNIGWLELLTVIAVVVAIPAACVAVMLFLGVELARWLRRR